MTQHLIIDGVDFTTTMTAGEVANFFRVDPKTVTRWAQDGRLAFVRTLGGHRRYSRTQVEALLRETAADTPPGGPDSGDTPSAHPGSTLR